MKNIFYLFICLCSGMVVVSCKDDERIRIPEYQTGVNLRIVLDPEHSSINSTSVSTDKVAFDVYSENDDLSLVEIFVHYKDQQHLMATFTQSDFNDGTEHLEFNAADLASWFGVPGFADGSRGGNFTIRPRVTLTDGRVYPDYIKVSDTDSIYNIAGSVQASSTANGAFTLAKGTAILCPPVDISGTYTVVEARGTSTDGCCPGVVTVSGNTVTITPDSDIEFTISDITGGLYFEWYDVYGITGPDDTPGTVTFNCNEITFSTPEPFGTNFAGEGLWDEATGTLTYSWANGYGDQGTITLVRQ